MKTTPLDKVGNTRGYKAVPVKCDTGVIEDTPGGIDPAQTSGNGRSIICDRSGDRHATVSDGVEFPHRKVRKEGNWIIVDNYRCTVSGPHGLSRRYTRHIINFVGGSARFKRIHSFLNGKMC